MISNKITKIRKNIFKFQNFGYLTKMKNIYPLIHIKKNNSFFHTSIAKYSDKLQEIKVIHEEKKKINTPNVNEGFFPYGKADFYKIRMEDLFYVDITAAFAKILSLEYCVLYKPPRFGKTMFLSALKYLLDRNVKKEDFDKLFKGLQIINPEQPNFKQLEKHFSQYYILELNLSVPINENDSFEVIKEKYDTSILGSLKEFCKDNGLDGTSAIKETDVPQSLRNVCNLIKKESLMIIIDEYDRGANKIIGEISNTLNEEDQQSSNEIQSNIILEKYGKIVKGQSGKADSAYIRNLFETIKKIESDRKGTTNKDGFVSQYKCIVAGIYPMVLADSYGSNIFRNISHMPIIVDSFGFTREQMKGALGYIIKDDSEQSNKNKEKILDVMEKHYNGYKFYRSKFPRFNTQNSLLFLQDLVNPVYRKEVLQWDIAKILPHDENKIEDNNSNPSPNVLNLLKYKGGITTNIVEALLWCNRQNSLKDDNTGEYNPYQSGDIRCIKNNKWGIYFGSSVEMKLSLYDLFASKNGKAVNNILFMLYSYGFITYESYENNTLCISNELIFKQLNDKINTLIYPQLMKPILDFLKKPSSRYLLPLMKEALQSQTTKDNYMNEGGIQLATEIALKNNHLITPVFGYAIEGTNKNDDYKKEIDFLLDNEDHSIMIEFKRNRPNSILVKGLNKPKKWTKSVFQNQQNTLDKMSDNAILDIPLDLKVKFEQPERKFDAQGVLLPKTSIKKEWKQNTQGKWFQEDIPCWEKCKTIREVQDQTINQLTRYFVDLNQHEGDKRKEMNIYAFAVLHIGSNTILVKDHPLNGTKFGDIEKNKLNLKQEK